MNGTITLAIVLAVSSIFGIWYNKTRGTVKAHSKASISPEELGTELGTRLTLVQFSSVFCSPCRATRILLEDITKNVPDVKHVDIDAESHLDLVRKLNILSTPTTLFLDKDGVEIGRAVGVPKRDQVADAITPMDI